jgi:hypothetical protein
VEARAKPLLLLLTTGYLYDAVVNFFIINAKILIDCEASDRQLLLATSTVLGTGAWPGK